ncbi:unnamed protein product [Cylicocyclus nassatus]|uniref:C2 domain-containing protein n=1 Tax=Cylicocyclus nassatus TaxID=53992 RepID=A0AA36GSY4_CYLNA|nr:unnamed protein product [Cylicocyclus nassatus]
MVLFLAMLPVILAESFWMTTELLRVDWKEGCLTTAGCSHPRFKDASRPFVTHWVKGIPEDLAVSCQVVGTDPIYGFPRICDQTASICVFEDRPFGRSRRHQVTTTITVPEEEMGKKLVEIRAKCFNVTLAVQKHTEKCPWCSDPKDVTVFEQKLPEDVPSADPASVFMRLLGDDTIMPLSMLVLAVIAVISPLGIACVLVAFLRLKRSNRQFSSKSVSQPPSRSNLVKIPIRKRSIHYVISSRSTNPPICYRS